MGYRALTHVHLGTAPPVEPGELIPEHYLDLLGEKCKVDFERLVELGAAEEAKVADELSSLKREDLNAHATGAGVENPEALPNKDAVIEAIKQAQTPAPAAEPEAPAEPPAEEPAPAAE